MRTTPPAESVAWHSADAKVEAVLADYEVRQASEDLLMAALSASELGRRRDEFLVSVGRATGLLLNLLVRESGARSILELGTSRGYSTVWLADAARATGGRVCTLDLVASKQEAARRALDRAGLLDVVDFRCGDAIELLAATDDRYEFVLLDVWKDGYIPCVDALRGRLAPGAIVVADNMCEPEVVRMAGLRYQAHVRRIPGFRTVLLPVGSGLGVSRYDPTLPAECADVDRSPA